MKKVKRNPSSNKLKRMERSFKTFMAHVKKKADEKEKRICI